ncbi:MAG TPA: ElyC/SanA/YdcF family protein, partial [Polyangiaceae bacterium]|nr:ElyC/SanA/YdcF family protein [Polyangiaceae bacterium]
MTYAVTPALRANPALAARGPLRAYPYAAVLVPGYGAAEQEESRLVAAPPDAPCRALSPGELARLGVNVERARRAAEAYRGGVAPVVIVSGGAVHSPLVEAFALASLVRCAGGVPTERVLVDPCADHTHTNLRNLGALVVALGARTGYLVTDGGLQSAYLSDFTVFDVFGGSVDQRSLRDFGYLVGAWRRASRGLDGGFWYTPYRFWAEREPVTCLAPGGEASD